MSPLASSNLSRLLEKGGHGRRAHYTIEMPQPSSPSNSYLDPRLVSLLDGIRRRVRRYVVCDSVLTVLAVILAAFWVGLALDYMPVVLGGTEMPWLARLILLICVAAIVIAIVWKRLIGRLERLLPDDSLALLVERHHPDLAGRLVTAVQLNRPGRSGDSHSPELLRHVHDEAASAIDQVDPARVLQLGPLIRKAFIAGPMLLMAIIMLAVSPQAFARAASRLTLLSDEPWPRRAHLEMVGIELPVVTTREDDSQPPKLMTFNDKVVRLPRGSSGSLRIRAQADDGAELPVVCTVIYETVADDDTASAFDLASSGQSNMRRVGRVSDGYQSFLLDGPPLESLSDSIDFSVRGLDDRLDGYRIEAVTPPGFTQTQVAVRYPNYLRTDDADAERSESGLDFDRVTTYQAGLRLAEGSDVTLIATSSVPLGESQVLVKSASDQEIPCQIQYSDDRRELRLQIDNFTTATTVSLVPVDKTGISAQAPYRYFLGVVLDEPPELKMKLVGIGSAVTPSAKIPIEATTQDDYGVAGLTVSVTPSLADKSDGLEEQAENQTASKTPSIDRDGRANAEMDLRDLIAGRQLPDLVPDDAINVIGEATDRYDLVGSHLTRSEIFRLQIVTPEKLLALLERRELALRARLEQTIDETRNLRDALNLLRSGFRVPAADQEVKPVGLSESTRTTQVRRLRIQQNGLQASKTSEELSGIATSLDDILLEMINNRVDSVDRQERIGKGVRDPLRQIVDDPLARLQNQITEVERSLVDDVQAEKAVNASVQTAEEVLLKLTAVLDKMLDLESYNEILEMVRGLIDDQEDLIEETKKERKKRVRDLFE